MVDINLTGLWPCHLAKCLVHPQFSPWSAFTVNSAAIDIIPPPAEIHTWEDKSKEDNNRRYSNAGIQGSWQDVVILSPPLWSAAFDNLLGGCQQG